MKKYTLLVFIILCLHELFAQETKTYYDNGQLKEVGVFDENSEKTGEWITYNKNGQVEGVRMYENGESGVWKFFDINGKLVIMDDYSEKK